MSRAAHITDYGLTLPRRLALSGGACGSYLIALLLLGQVFSSAAAQQRRTVDRSPVDLRYRQTDELLRPRYRERSTHRGFEVRGDQFVVVSQRSREDARRAAQQFRQAWGDIGQLADHWMEIHRRPNFAIGSVLIYLDSEPVRERDLPLTTLQVLGGQTAIYLNLSSAQPLEQQTARLQMATVHAFLHVTEMDEVLPRWVRDGLAAYVALAEQSQPVSAQPAWDDLPQLRGDYWNWPRSEQDQLQVVPRDPVLAAQQVTFLLEGNDAQLAPAFVAALRETVDSALRRPPAPLLVRGDRRRAASEPTATPVDQLRERTFEQFQQWTQDLLAGQPLLAPPAGSAADEGSLQLRQRQREMLTVLKLLHRFHSSADPAPAARVVEFRNGQAAAVPPAAVAQSQPRGTFESLVARMMQAPDWASVGADGRLLWSSERQRLQQLLGLAQQRYRTQWEDERLVLIGTWEDGQRLEGWLDANADHPSRPRAVFRLPSQEAKAAIRTVPPGD